MKLERYDPIEWYAEIAKPPSFSDGSAPFVRVLTLPNREEPEYEGSAVVFVGGAPADAAKISVSLSIYGEDPELPLYSLVVSSAKLAVVIANGLEPENCSPDGLRELGFRPEEPAKVAGVDYAPADRIF